MINETTPERAAELDATHAVMYRNRKPHFRYIVVFRPNGSITWSQSTEQPPGYIAPNAMLYTTHAKANVRANEIRKMDVRIARPVPHLVKYEARVIKVLLPR